MKGSGTYRGGMTARSPSMAWNDGLWEHVSHYGKEGLRLLACRKTAWHKGERACVANSRGWKCMLVWLPVTGDTRC
jgi:hypothetical protein